MLQSVKARREEILKLEGYVHIIVPGYFDVNFRQHFRLRRGTVEIFHQMIGTVSCNLKIIMLNQIKQKISLT